MRERTFSEDRFDEREEEEDDEDEDDQEGDSPLKLRAELENIEDDFGEVLVPAPPDGGWGWVICFASFMCNLILDGIAYSFGVLLNPLCTYFESDKATVAWVGSILCGVYLMSGPIVGGLVNKFGCRFVCMLGSTISFIAFSLSIFSPNVPTLMLLYGIIGGFGLGLIYLPAVVAVGYYFEKKRALATGISVCGSGVGTFIFAPLTTVLLDAYGWRGANLIFAALCLQCAVCGALMRPLELPVNVEDEDDEDKFVLNLPDGTSHKQVVKDGDCSNSSSTHFEMPSSPSHRVLPTLKELPTITEQSITASNVTKEEHKSVQEVFPARLPVRKRSRVRTTSETAQPAPAAKFHISTVRSPTKESKMIRNQSAPHFTLTQRNLSSTGLPRIGSQCDYSVHGSGSINYVNGLDMRKSQTKISVNPMSRKDIFYTGSVAALAEQEDDDQHEHFKSQASIKGGLKSNKHSYISVSGLRSNKQSFLSIHRGSLVNSNLALPMIHEGRRRPSFSAKSHMSEIIIEPDGGGMLAALKEMMNFSLLKDPLFLLVGISNVFGMMGFYTPFVYLPDMAEQYEGITKDSASFLISVIGISNTLGRVVSGWLSDFPWVNSLVVTNMAIILSAVSVFLFPFCTSYTAFVIVALFFGLFVAAYISLTSIVLVDLCGLDNLTSAFGLLTLFRGSSSMIGPPINGFIFESTKNFDLSFYVSGGFLLVAGLISCLVDVLKRRRNHGKETHL